MHEEGKKKSEFDLLLLLFNSGSLAIFLSFTFWLLVSHCDDKLEREKLNGLLLKWTAEKEFSENKDSSYAVTYP